MLLARFSGVLLLVALVSLAKSPTESSTVCDRHQRSDMIFTGSAQGPWIALFDAGKSPIHKRSEKSQRVRFLAREWYKGQRHDFVDVWMTPSECPLKVEANEMYLIYARLDKDTGRIESNACMGTIPAATAAADLTYLQASLWGPGFATRISGTAGHGDLNIQAKSGINTRYALTDGAGRFTFDGLAPGEWQLSVVGGTPKSVQLAPDSCVMEELH
jgi:hypothetical protein